ncbi:coagulation factor 5 8 type domain protein [Fusarium beomiforme]|uniref:Coagulation factor 5 8 type domain protein n=1 Tax=Fusarium beomiforme TaxID=44412 RepID=A0A9P5DVY8_9HYPO|nr:coagulation factor 5 8 type domain protein [Fusarium beomiforme]
MTLPISETRFLNCDLLLKSLEDQQWFEKNIPLLDLPDRHIQQVYYYRWQTYKEHLVYTGAQYGYMTSEFLNPVSYGAPYGGIVAAAGHHITEGRWLRDTRYGQDIARYWITGPGQFRKPMRDDVNKDTRDWAHEYSFWAATALWKQYLVTGDEDFVVGKLKNLVKQYRGWDSHYSSSLGLYWQVPVWDATEYTAASYESSDPYHGGAGFRPTINSYQYGDAVAIAEIAALCGDSDLEDEYRKRAESLRTALQKHLWDNESKFYKHQARDENPSGALLSTREIMGYLPWMFNMPCENSQLVCFSQLTDPEGFFSNYGPTTAERRSKWFMFEAENCCRWNGPSWPFATSQTLTAVENVLHDYSAQSYITAEDYYDMLHQYARTQYKNGQPHVAEAHHPDDNVWIYDGRNHSEDYNHSTFVDNVLAGLIGLRAQPDDTILVNPLTPASWDYFAVENAAYHGHSITVLWDRHGSVYNQGEGLRAYVDGQLVGRRRTIGPIKVDVGPPMLSPVLPCVNIAANGQRCPELPMAFASYTSPFDDPMRAIDGIIFRTGIPQNSRWTSYNSPNRKDHFGVDLHRQHIISNVRLFFYDDSDGVRVPISYDLQYWVGDDWVTVPGQVRSPIPTSSNSETKIDFPAILTSRLRVVAPNSGSGVGWGLSEFEIWKHSDNCQHTQTPITSELP